MDGKPQLIKNFESHSTAVVSTEAAPVTPPAKTTTDAPAPAQKVAEKTVEQKAEETKAIIEHLKPNTTVKHPHKKLFGGMNHDTAEYVIESLSMLLQASMSVGESLESIATEITNKKVKAAILQMRTSVDEGAQFSRAMEQTGLFAPSVITLIELGEATGHLPQNLRVVSVQMHKTNQMSSRIKSAMLYPAFLVGLLFVVGTGIGTFLLPKLLTIIKGLGEKVGPLTKALIFIGTYFGHYGLFMAGAVVMIGLGIGIAIKINYRAKSIAESIMFHTPGIKKLLFESELARFGFIFGSMLDAGLPVVSALQSLSTSMSTHRYQTFASELGAKVNEGNAFGRLLVMPEYRKMLSGTICQIVISAEKSGNLSACLLEIGDNYQDKADLTARNLETLLEPIVLVLIAVAVLFIAMAVFLPIYSLIGQFNTTGT